MAAVRLFLQCYIWKINRYIFSPFYYIIPFAVNQIVNVTVV